VGFYDVRCMITGVSLRGTDAVAVVVGPDDDDEYRPVTVGIAGTYDRLGSIDGIDEDRSTELVVRYFADRAGDGRLYLDPGYEGVFGDPREDIEALLHYFERNVADSSDESPAAALDGRRLFPVLIARTVWDALAVRTTGAPVEAPSEIYAGHEAEVEHQLRALANVAAFLRERDLPWTLPDEETLGAQHDGDDMRQFLDTARIEFDDVTAVEAALDAYELDVEALLNEDD
jgi:hypothetical protein